MSVKIAHAVAPIGTYVLYAAAPSGDTTGATDTAALNALTGQGAIIVLRSGTYRVNANLLVPNQCYFMGMGKDVTYVKNVNGFTGAPFKNAGFAGGGNTFVGVTDLTIDCNSLGSYGINFIGTGRGIFRNLRITGATTIGLLLDGNQLNTSRYTWMENIEADTCAVGISISNGQRQTFASKLLAHDCTGTGGRGSKQAGIVVDASEFHGTDLYGYKNAGIGIYVNNIFESNLTGLHASLNGMDGIYSVGVVDSVGSNWKGHLNGSSGAGFADIYFATGNPQAGGGYGTTAGTTITGIRAGGLTSTTPGGNWYSGMTATAPPQPNWKPDYGLFVETGVGVVGATSGGYVNLLNVELGAANVTPYGGVNLASPAAGALNVRFVNQPVSGVESTPLWSPSPMRPSAALAEAFPRLGSGWGLSTTQPASGAHFVTPILLPAGMQIGSIGFASGGTAAVTPTHWWFTLLDGNGNLLAETGDALATAWGTATVQQLAVGANASNGLQSTTIAAGSNGVDVSTFAGAGTLNVASTTGFPAAGTIAVPTSTGIARVTYTDVTANTFTGCTVVGGTTHAGVKAGTFSTGATVWQQRTFTTTYNGVHLVGLMVAAATVPAIACAPGSTPIDTMTPILTGTVQTAQTTPPAFPTAGLTVSEVNQQLYAFVGA